MSVIAKITNFFFNIMELLLQLIPYGYSNSGLPPQHHQVLLPLRLKIHTLVDGVEGGEGEVKCTGVVLNDRCKKARTNADWVLRCRVKRHLLMT